MDNPETLVTLGIQHTGKKKQIKKTHTTQTPKKISNTDPTKNSRF